MKESIAPIGTKESVQSIRMKKLKKFFQRRIVPSIPLYILMLPAIIYTYLLEYVPMYGVQIAFRNFNIAKGITGSDWVGLSHFIRFFESPQFFKLIRNTLTLTLGSLLMFPIPILLALFLNYCVLKKFRKVVQMATYAPHFISVVVIVGMINVFFSPLSGIVNKFIEMLGGSRVNFLIEPGYFKYLFIGSGVWASAGWSSILYIGALTSVDPEQHEAAIIDGATKLRRIWHIDLPGIAPTIIILFILRMGSLMSLGFQKVFLMQNDAILPVSEVISTYVYKVGLIQGNFSYSTAIGLFNTLINVLLLVIANAVAKKVSSIGLW